MDHQITLIQRLRILFRIYLLIAIFGASVFTIYAAMKALPSCANSGIVLGTLLGLYLVTRRLYVRAVGKSIKFRKYSFHPPSVAEYAFYVLAPRRFKEELLGDLREGFISVAEDKGLGVADIWYWNQLAGSVFPLLWLKLRSAIGAPVARPKVNPYKKR